MARGPRAVRLVPAELATVLVCRINARMGNAMFLTPLIERLRELLPRAAIDVASAYPYARELLGPIPGVRHVIAFPYKGVQLPWRYAAALGRVRRERYDLAIDPAPDSTSDRIVLTLARARYRLGFASASQWAPLTHAVPLPQETLHQAVQPVYLLSRALGAELATGPVRLQLSLTKEELAAGRAAVEHAIAAKAAAPVAARIDGVFGFFAHATGHKTIAREYWRAFWSAFLELEPDAVPLEILPAADRAATDARSAVLHLESPRVLAAAISSTRLFIAGDTGPMHLASSTAVPTVALFQASDPALYGPLKPCDLALDPAHCPPLELAQRCRALWHAARTATEARASSESCAAGAGRSVSAQP
ncbi:MAG: glycosyltransferase family 9 protein [Steroidobacteraceae bacterium]